MRREKVGRKIVKMTLLWRKITFLIDVAIAILALAKGDEADRVEISMLSFAGIAHTIRNQSDIFYLMFFFYLYNIYLARYLPTLPIKGSENSKKSEWNMQDKN